MRAAFLVLLLLLPLASGWPLSPPVDEASETFHEWPQERLLVNEEGVWTSEGWEALLALGIQPLRSVRPDALLVWQVEEVQWPSFISVEAFDDAAYLAPLVPVDEGAVRVVLEPRLPPEAIERTVSDVVAVGGRVLELRQGFASLPTSLVVDQLPSSAVPPLLDIPGVLWIEPVLTTTARNGQAASLVQSGSFGQHPFWEVGINGSGVVLGVADSGLDADHACFRNATTDQSVHAEASADHPAVGLFGSEHRKILLMNTTLDDNDTPGHSDYRHGTHVIGSLACFNVYDARSGQAPSNGSSLAYEAKLVIQDIVSPAGWVPPEVDQLLWEASAQGAVIHSNSWGDDTTAYTERTGRFDAYARAMPWSTAFIAPGNSGEGVLEPANGRNVVAVGASTKATMPERWSSSSYGPTEAGTDGLFLLAPGVAIQSAAADGFWSSNNDNLRSSSGTSMATPLAASSAGLIQQLYEDGWLHGAHEPLTAVTLSVPNWSSSNGPTTLLLGDGFTPSGPLLRATLALAATPLASGERNGGLETQALHNAYDGWGVVSLSQLVDAAAVMNGSSPASSIWVHDSYRLESTSVATWFSTHGGTESNLSGLMETPWNGSGAHGPFLGTGDVFRQRFTPLPGEDVMIRLSFPAQPAPALVEDLQLRVVLENGDVLLPDRLKADGSPTRFNASVADFSDAVAFPNSNETTVGLNVPADYLTNASWMDIEVVARYVQPGERPGTVGLDGDAVGFALVVKGVERDADDHLDGDGDGVVNMDDACPNEEASGHDLDEDGCIDDTDGDGVKDNVDACPNEAAAGFDADGDGCIDDTDGDGVKDHVDECPTPDLAWPVNEVGCYPTDRPPTLHVLASPANNTTLDEALGVSWRVVDDDMDGALVRWELVFANQTSTAVLTCMDETAVPAEGACDWALPEDFTPYYIKGERYRLQATLTTTNASPAAATEPIIIVVADGLLVPEDTPVVDSVEGGERSVPVMVVVFLGILGGVLFARFQASWHHRSVGLPPNSPFPDQTQWENE